MFMKYKVVLNDQNIEIDNVSFIDDSDSGIVKFLGDKHDLMLAVTLSNVVFIQKI